MQTVSKRLSVILLLFVLLTSACKANLSRNDDGTLQVETAITQQELQEVISSSIADPLVEGITVSLQSGYVLVSGERQRLNDASKTDTLTFRLDLGVTNGQLTSTISNAQLDNQPIEQARVDNWNQTIVNRLAKISNRRQDAALQSVSVTPDQVSMNWTVSR